MNFKMAAQSILMSAFILVSTALSQPNLQPAPAGGNISHGQNALDSFQFYLCAIIFLFGSLVIVAQFWMLRHISGLTGDDIAKNCVITVVICAALVLVIAGYDNTQIAPAFGLFGTVAGYLLGKGDKSGTTNGLDRTEKSRTTDPVK